MFRIKLAGIPIGIDARYPYVSDLCHAYLTDQPPVFTVRATEEELQAQRAADPDSHLWYCESLCLYRKICMRLPRYDAFLMHAAVVAVDGVAYVFAAPSGVGKTTHMKLWLEQFGSRAKVVNGDKPILRFIDGVLYACGSPWQGSENWGNNIMCPVMGICFLEQARDTSICPLVKEDVIRRLLPQVYRPRKQEDFDSVWLVLDRLVTTADFYLLKCNRDPEAARLSYLTMRRKIEC